MNGPKIPGWSSQTFLLMKMNQLDIKHYNIVLITNMVQFRNADFVIFAMVSIFVITKLSRSL